MNDLESINLHEEFIETYIDLPIAVLKIKKNGFKYLSSIDKSNIILEWYHEINKVKEIKAILAISDEEAFSSQNYHGFLSSICGCDLHGIDPSEIGAKLKSKERAIEMNMFSNYARRLLNVEKLLIFCGAGEIVTPFFGLSLLADLRFVSDKMYYSLEHQKYGIHPSGFLPFFLPKFVGRGRAMKILLSNETISAGKAHELGLVEKVFPSGSFEESCVAEAKRISAFSSNMISTTKTLVNTLDKELENFIEREENYIHR